MPFFLEVHVKGFNEIASRNDLAMFLKIPISKLTYILYVVNPDKCYHSFSIPKKSGGERIIDAPNDDLKPIQIKLSKCLWEYQQDIWKRNGITPNIAHAFQLYTPSRQSHLHGLSEPPCRTLRAAVTEL
jgi:hypothetical protein